MENWKVNEIICNVTKVNLSYQERHILIVDVWVDLPDGGTLSVTNTVLDTYDKDKKKRVGTAYGCEFIRQLLDFFGVDDLSQVKNYKCYLLTEKERIWSCTDVLGLKQLPFDEYSHRQQEFIKKDIYEEFLGNNDSE